MKSQLSTVLFVLWSFTLAFPQEYQVDQNTVALWHFNEGQGSATQDASANDYDGNIIGATWSQSGKFGNALSFSGSDYVDVDKDLDLDVQMTIEAWVQPNGVPENDNYAIVSKFENDADEAKSFYFAIRQDQAGNFEFDGAIGRGVDLGISSSIPWDNNMHHFAMTFENGVVKGYIDGVFMGQQNAGVNAIPNTDQSIWIGRRGNNGRTFGRMFMKGIIDEVRISNIAREPSEFNINSNPVAQCKDITVSADANCIAQLSIDNSSFDPDGDPITISQDPAGPYSIGTTEVTLTVSDNMGGTDQCTATVTVVDDKAPVFSVVSTPSILWPPNHKYGTFTVGQFVNEVSDNCTSLSVSDIVITKVTSDEEDDAIGGGDGNTSNDIVIDPRCQSVQLRAERQGSGNGRVYTIYLSVDDGNGNTGTAMSQVTVPKSQNGTPAVDDGPISTVMGSCGSLSKSGAPREEFWLGESLPEDFKLEQNHPNPFNPSTSITFALTETGEINLSIYNLKGQLIRTLISSIVTAGQHSVVWDGTNFNGAIVASGIYVYKLQAKDFVATRKLVFTK